ncbi:MAG TPA: glycosyltransferase family 4 protein [Gemmatimonadales bacterium]|nr:glycosyltransferase family 4 protein [Gemmatimonadales bacterium]
MNILIVNYEYPPLGGGGGVVSALIAEELARRHRVVVVTSAWDGLPRRETAGGVEVHRVRVMARDDQSVASIPSLLTFPPAAWLALGRLLRRERFDLINGHFAVPTGPGSLPPARLRHIPHVLSLHGGDIYDPSKRLSPHRSPVLRAVVTWAMRRSDRVVAQSTNTRDNAYKYYGYRGPIEIVPLGIRQPPCEPASRAELGLPESAFLAVTVGRLVRRKAIDVLLRALTLPGCEEVHLAVVGAGPEQEMLARLAGEWGVAQRVRFLGFVPESRKWQILRASDAYVSSTMHEGFGLVYLEAMTAGLPVVTPNHGGQVDFLRDGETGHLVPPGDAEALAGAIGRLRADPAGAARMREHNLRLAPQHNIVHCAAAYERLFAAVAARKPPDGR